MSLKIEKKNSSHQKSHFTDYFDLLSEKPELKINGNSRFHSYFGNFIGILLFVFTFIVTIIFINDIFKKKKYSIIYNVDNRQDPDISLNTKYIGLLITDLLGKEIPNYSRVYEIKAKFWQFNLTKAFQSNGTLEYISATEINQISCQKAYPHLINMNNQDTFKYAGLLIKSAVCLDLSDTYVNFYGKYGTSFNGFSMINIYLNKCVNTTTKTDCYPNEMIENILSHNSLSILTSDYDINPDLIDSPLQEYIKLEQIIISSTIFKNFYKEYNKIIFDDDIGLIADNMRKLTGYRSDSIYESVDLRGDNTLYPGTFNQVSIRCSGKTEIYLRSFAKLQNAFANISGVVQVIYYVIRVLIYFWSKNSMLEFLILKLINIEENLICANQKHIKQEDFNIINGCEFRRIQYENKDVINKKSNNENNNNIELINNSIANNKIILQNNLKHTDLNIYKKNNNINLYQKNRNLKQSRENKKFESIKIEKNSNLNFSNNNDSNLFLKEEFKRGNDINNSVILKTKKMIKEESIHNM